MLTPGLKGEATLFVEDALSANAMGSGTLDVLATPAMIALMEKAAWTCVAPYLPEGAGTVGIRLEISHISPTPLGRTVTAAAELMAVNGKTLVFRVSASDEGGLIGEGRHDRAVIDEEKFMTKANKK